MSCDIHKRYVKAAELLKKSGYQFQRALREHVYIAFNDQLGKVVIKFASSLPSRYGLQQSAEFLTKHHSPYWPTLFDYSGHNQVDWHITRYIEGDTLAASFNKSVMAMSHEPNHNHQHSIDWLHSLESAIHTLHQHGYVHRDIKPSNLLLCESKNIMIIDFSSIIQIGLELESLPYHFHSSGYSRNNCLEVSGATSIKDDWYSISVTLSNVVSPPFYHSHSLPSRYQILMHTLRSTN